MVPTAGRRIAPAGAVWCPWAWAASMGVKKSWGARARLAHIMGRSSRVTRPAPRSHVSRWDDEGGGVLMPGLMRRHHGGRHPLGPRYASPPCESSREAVTPAILSTNPELGVHIFSKSVVRLKTRCACTVLRARECMRAVHTWITPKSRHDEPRRFNRLWLNDCHVTLVTLVTLVTSKIPARAEYTSHTRRCGR